MKRRRQKKPLYRVKCNHCGGMFEATSREAKRCFEHRYIGRTWGPNRKKYDWTEERVAHLVKHYNGLVYGRAAEIAKHLGFPTWEIKKRAGELGLCKPAHRRAWTPDEETDLRRWVNERRTTRWIALETKRSQASIVMKLKHMEISRRWVEAYTARRLALCFGVDSHKILDWIRARKLHAIPRGTQRRPGQGGDEWVIQPSDVLEFIETHPLEFDIRKVEQAWFMDLILRGGLVRRALDQAGTVAV